MEKTIILIILDGWGIGLKNRSNPIYEADTKNLRWIEEKYPLTSLQASGISVGLPWGEAGNCEVGHLTIGAGRTIYQDFPRITMAIQNKSFFENKALKDAINHSKKNGSSVNIIGLLSKDISHSSIEHINAIVKMAESENVKNINLHLFGDGKDSPPKSILDLINRIPKQYIANIIGRYYAMNSNENWHLTQTAYNCFTDPSMEAANIEEEIKKDYESGLTDEFIRPIRAKENGYIKENESVIFFNYEESGIRQLALAFASDNFDKFPAKKLKNLFVSTLTDYGKDIKAEVAFPNQEVNNTLSQILSKYNKSQLKVAESESYPYITFFFNAYKKEPYKGEYRVEIPSPNIIHPEEHPELMAKSVTDRIIEGAKERSFNFIAANYANPNLVAHTGNYDACVKTAEIIDGEIGRIIKSIPDTEAVLIITSDHGNMESVFNMETGAAETESNSNPVPFYIVGERFRNRKFINWKNLSANPIGIISDVAPTILELIGIEKPKEMDGESLLKNLI